MADETDCLGYTTDVRWNAWGGPHPVSYNASDITAQTIASLRNPANCDPAAALKCALLRPSTGRHAAMMHTAGMHVFPRPAHGGRRACSVPWHVKRVSSLPELCAHRRLSSFMFVRAGSAPSSKLCEEDSPWSHRLLHKECPLFARKFLNHTAAEVRAPTACRPLLSHACPQGGALHAMAFVYWFNSFASEIERPSSSGCVGCAGQGAAHQLLVWPGHHPVPTQARTRAQIPRPQG